MRVALACHNLPPEFQGGTERVVLALARALQHAGDDVLVVCGSDRAHDGTDVLHEEADGVAVRRVPRRPDEGYGLELQRPRVAAIVADLLAASAREVLHVHHWSTLSITMLRQARERGLGTVATLHDMWTACPRFFRRPPEGITCPQAAGREPCAACAARDLQVTVPRLRLGIALRDREVQAELQAAGAVTAPSAFAAAAVREHVPWGGPIEVVPHGLLEVTAPRVPVPSPCPSSSASSQASAPASADDAPRLRVGTFGNLVEEKGVALLVEAVAGLPVELHLAGPFLEPEFRDRVLRRAAELGVTCVAHGPYAAQGGDGDGGAGAVRHPAERLDLAVFPSLCAETYGLVVEEALSRGVPVVVSDRGALRERIGDAGVAVPPEVPALAAAIAAFVRDPDLRARQRRAIPAQFATIADAALRYRELYARALSARRSA